jgi:hypothetical protein
VNQKDDYLQAIQARSMFLEYYKGLYILYKIPPYIVVLQVDRLT